MPLKIINRRTGLGTRVLSKTSVAAAILLALFVLQPARIVFSQQNKESRRGERAIRHGEYDEAARIFADLMKKQPADMGAILGESLAHFRLKQYARCFDDTGQALKIDPDNARAHALRGYALLRSGYFPNSIAELAEALRINPKEALAWGALAEIDYYNNQTKECQRKANYAFSLDSSNADSLMTYARASSRMEQFNQAADAYELYLQIAPRGEKDNRDRIRGLVQFYRQLVGLHLHRIDGPRSMIASFRLGADRRPYMNIRANGRDATFVIDTGSGFTVISVDAAKRLGVRAVARGGTSQGVGGSGKFPIVYGLINSMNIGDERVESIPCFIRPFPEGKNPSPDTHADGFIGLSILSSFVTSLDYKRRLISLTRAPEGQTDPIFASPDATVIPFRTTENGLISLETRLNGTHVLNAILDTAASSSVISTAAVKRLDMDASIIKGETVQVVGAAGISDDVPLLMLHDCEVADLQQTNMRALVLDFAAINETSGFEQGGILGGDFLTHFKITLDFDRGRVALEPQTRAITRLQPPSPSSG
ncbi:MAG TPA: aspartyl protease family protein [Blastocatellia bacterium]|nr:aspartyl protease family protein [Blastocatellia bacterium]